MVGFDACGEQAYDPAKFLFLIRDGYEQQRVDDSW